MSENAQQAYQYLIEKGVPPIAAAAAVGHFQSESGDDLNTEAIHDQGTGYGIAGWRDPEPGKGRKTQLMNFAKENDADPSSLETQLDFFVHEIGTTESDAGERLWNAGSLEEANDAMFDYERPAKRNTEERLSRAQKVYSSYGDGEESSDGPDGEKVASAIDVPELESYSDDDEDDSGGESDDDEDDGGNVSLAGKVKGWLTGEEPEEDDGISLAAKAKGWLTGEEPTATDSNMGAKVFSALSGIGGGDEDFDPTPAGENMDVDQGTDQGVDIDEYDKYMDDVAYMADGGEVEDDPGEGFDVNEVMRELGI